MDYDECAHLYGGDGGEVRDDETKEEEPEPMSPSEEAEMWMKKWETESSAKYAYDSLTTIPLTGVCTFWKNNLKGYGPLCHVARSDLSTDASAAAIERSFSDLPCFVTTRRGSMRPDKVEMLMLTHAGLHKYKLTPDSLVRLPLEGEENREVREYMPRRMYDPELQDALSLLFADDDERGTEEYYLDHFE